MRLFMFLLFLLFAGACFGQVKNQSAIQKQTDYLKKSRNQNKAGWILLGSGAGLTVLAFALPVRLIDEGSPFSPFDDKYSTDWSLLLLPGIAAMLTSIPLFIASSRNARRAAAVTTMIRLESRPAVEGGMISRINYPAVSLVIKL